MATRVMYRRDFATASIGPRFRVQPFTVKVDGPLYGSHIQLHGRFTVVFTGKKSDDSRNIVTGRFMPRASP